jgi:hypothetical protein
MRKSAIWFGATVLVIALLMVGCAHDKAGQPMSTESKKALIHKEVSDPVKAEAIVALTIQMKADLDALMKVNIDTQKEFQSLNTNYDTTHAQFEEFLADSRQAKDKAREKILDAYFRIKALTTPQEWEVISKIEMQTINGMLNKTPAPSKE